MADAPFVTRFAPSPTGWLHRGHAFSALTAAEAARRAGGRFLLRIEDIDTVRCRPAYVDGILEDLAWLGLSWGAAPRRQSLRLAAYEAALDRLREAGLLYRCFRTRRDLADEISRAPHGDSVAISPGPHPAAEEAEQLARGTPFAWRLSIEGARKALGGFSHLTFLEEGQGPAGQGGVIAARPDLSGDIILARKDVGVSYHLAVVVDDADQGVSHVIRGQDLFAATHVQRLLQALLTLPTPTYRHHPLILRPDGKRFAKRDTAETLRDLRAQGLAPEALRRELGFA